MYLVGVDIIMSYALIVSCGYESCATVTGNRLPDDVKAVVCLTLVDALISVLLHT